MFEPGVGIRGEVGIVTENIFRSFKFLQLYQQAVLADKNQ
jgi:hypothetical protein